MQALPVIQAKVAGRAVHNPRSKALLALPKPATAFVHVIMGRRGGGGGSPAQLRAQAAVEAATATAGGSGSLTVLSARPLSTLWAGYGTITEIQASTDDDDDTPLQLIVKEVQPPAGSGVSHERKLRSYQIEAAFYQRVAPRLPAGAACHLPRCLGVHSTLHSTAAGSRSSDGSGGMQLVMTDLREEFPSRCGSLDEAHTKAALSWLAAFHAASWGANARELGLWPEACYWHLKTRQEELADIGREWRQLQAAAAELDCRLQQSPFRTLCHGDFKTENLLFAGSGSGGGGIRCAAYDFQYIGGGCGVKDVVYLFASGVQARLLQQPEGEARLLRHYHEELVRGLQELAAAAAGPEAGAAGGGSVGCPAAAAKALEQYSYEAMYEEYKVAMCDYVRFMAGWGFWGNTSWAAAKARQFMSELGLA